MPLNKIYMLDHIQSFNNEPIHNIYFLESLDAGDAVDAVSAFTGSLLTKVRNLQCEQILTTGLRCTNLGSPTDWNEVALSLTGTLTGHEMLPVFNALGYTLKPTNRTIRPGSKRIAGVPETCQVDGTITEGSYITAMETLRAAFGALLTSEDASTFTLVVVKRVKEAVPDTDPVEYTYRLPETDDELVFAPLGAVKTSTKVKHQVSRGN
jgi:hypothetical protein